MVAPLVVGGIFAGASLLSSFASASMAGQAGKAAFSQSVYAAGLRMRAGEQEAWKNHRLANNYFLDAFRASEKRDIALREKRREHKIISGKNRGQQQGLESDGTTRSMAVEQQEEIMQYAEDVIEWDWDNSIQRLEMAGHEANYAAEVAYINGVNDANGTLYSGGMTAAAHINQANMTMAMALPKAALAGFSGYALAGGTFAAETAVTETASSGAVAPVVNSNMHMMNTGGAMHGAGSGATQVTLGTPSG